VLLDLRRTSWREEQVTDAVADIEHRQNHRRRHSGRDVWSGGTKQL
jgi:hypothetical protein